MQKQLLQMGTIDTLTGIANQGTFLQMGEEEAIRSVRYGHVFSVMMLDIDCFKSINESYGIPVGDEVLKKLVSIGAQALRSADIMGRLGGGEFGIILTETGAKAALVAAERLRRAFENAAVNLEDGRAVKFTVSIGVAAKLSIQESFEELLKKAEHALYKAKNAGRNCVCMAT